MTDIDRCNVQLSTVRERDFQPINVPSILVLSRFHSLPNGSVPASAVRVLSCISSPRAVLANVTFQGQKGH